MWYSAAAICLAGCGQAQVDNSAAPTPHPTYKAVGEFKGIELGSSFEEVISTVDADLFNPYGLKECFQEIALRGCFLSRKSDDTIFEMRSGVPYALKLSFNRFDKLTDLGLNYHREGKISADQCRDIFARTIDWVAQDYGPVTHRNPSERSGERPEEGNVVAKTPDGNEYAYLKPHSDGSYVTKFINLASETVVNDSAKDKGRVLTSRGVSLFSSYIVVNDKPICDVDLEFVEPDRVERRIYTVDDEE